MQDDRVDSTRSAPDPMWQPERRARYLVEDVIFGPDGYGYSLH